MVFYAFVLALILPVCCVCPGFLFVSKFDWRPLEKLAASIGVSIFVLYLLTFALYWTHIDFRWCWAITAASFGAGVIRRRDLTQLFKADEVRRVLIAFGLILFWTLVLLASIRHYSGGGWIGDWAEHFHRTMFFLKRLPSDTLMFPDYRLSARPPAMNLVSTFFLAQTAFRFDLYQLVFTTLSAVAFIPACLCAGALRKRRNDLTLTMAALLGLNPMFVQNCTYPWTKLLAAFYVLLGLWFYLSGWKQKDGVRIVTAWTVLSVGTLVHYSVLPYFICLLAHYWVVPVWNLRKPVQYTTLGASVCVLILATWIAWSWITYGPGITFTSNTTVTASAPAMEPPPTRILLNLRDTLVPHTLRTNANMHPYNQLNRFGYIRDYMFLLYQSNLFMMMGSINGIIAAVLFFHLFRSGSSGRFSKAQGLFWISFVIGCVTIGVAVNSDRNPFGVGHVTLQPVALLGLCLIASNMRVLPRYVRWLIVAGCAVDLLLGIFLQVDLQHRDLDRKHPSEGSFRLVYVHRDGQVLKSVDTDLSSAAKTNLVEKYGLASSIFGYPAGQPLEFIGDRVARVYAVAAGMAVLIGILMIGWLMKEAVPKAVHGRAVIA